MDPKGTIIYVGGFELPDKNAAAHRVINNSKIFEKLGYNVVFLGITKLDEISEKENNLFELESYPTIYPKTIKEWFKYISNIDLLKNILNKHHDVKAIICYNYPSIGLNKIRKLGNKKGIKVIADITEWYSGAAKNLLLKLVKKIDIFFRMRVIHKKLDGAITISQYLYDYYNKKVETILIPALVDLSEEKWQKGSDNKKKRYPILTYSGTPAKEKDNLSQVINALDKIDKSQKFEMRIVGLSKKQYLQLYPKDESKLSQFKNDIIFYGRVSHKKSLEILKNSDYSIFYRTNTIVNKAGYPTKFSESISCGVPVITTNNYNLKNYIKNGKLNGYMFSEDEFIESLGNIIKNFKDIDIKINEDIFHFDNYLSTMKKLLDKI